MQFTELEKEIIKDISYVYSLNKEFFIKAEEYIDGLKYFVTPVLEHRDALDHLINAFKDSFSEKNCEEQLKNARDHELRSFFDIADYICIKIRTKINSDLKNLSVRKIQKYWSEYLEIKNKMVNLSTELAEIRISRDKPVEAVPKYEKLLREQIDYYINNYLKIIEPKLKGRRLN